MPFCLKCQHDYPDSHKVCPQCASGKYSGNPTRRTQGNLWLTLGAIASVLLALLAGVRFVFALIVVSKTKIATFQLIEQPLQLVVFVALTTAFRVVASSTSRS